jgi:DNA-binding cell septation regulator SpoVG
MSFGISVVNVRPSNSTSAVQAYVDIRLNFDVGTFKVSGLSVIEKDGKPPWVAFPQKPGKNGNKYFPVVEAEGRLKELIASAVLDAYVKSKN